MVERQFGHGKGEKIRIFRCRGLDGLDPGDFQRGCRDEDYPSSRGLEKRLSEESGSQAYGESIDDTFQRTLGHQSADRDGHRVGPRIRYAEVSCHEASALCAHLLYLQRSIRLSNCQQRFAR